MLLPERRKPGERVFVCGVDSAEVVFLGSEEGLILGVFAGLQLVRVLLEVESVEGCNIFFVLVVEMRFLDALRLRDEEIRLRVLRQELGRHLVALESPQEARGGHRFIFVVHWQFISDEAGVISLALEEELGFLENQVWVHELIRKKQEYNKK